MEPLRAQSGDDREQHQRAEQQRRAEHSERARSKRAAMTRRDKRSGAHGRS
jgi:hypothetical protein